MPQTTTMTPDLMSAVHRQITPETIRAIASRLGEDGERTASAVSTGIPSVLAALSDVARSETGADHLKELIDERRGPHAQRVEGAAALLDATGSNGHGHEASLLDDELGQRSWTISDAVARSSGIRRESAHKLLGGVTSVAVLAVAANAGNLTAGGLRSLFSSQRREWIKRLPSSMASAFETPGATTVAAPATNVVRGTAIREIDRPRRSWLVPIVLALVALLLIPLIRGRHHRAEPVRETVTRSIPAPAKRQATLPAARPSTQAAAEPRALPTEPLAARGAPLSMLPAFLASSEGTTPRRFAMPPLGFETGAVEPSPDSAPTIKQVADQLQAHSSATLRVESFTDNVGAPEDNLDLSRRRSETVKALLVEDGADASRIEVGGLGQARPIASNDTEEGRRQNRRTDLIVTQR